MRAQALLQVRLIGIKNFIILFSFSCLADPLFLNYLHLVWCTTRYMPGNLAPPWEWISVIWHHYSAPKTLQNTKWLVLYTPCACTNSTCHRVPAVSSVMSWPESLTMMNDHTRQLIGRAPPTQGSGSGHNSLPFDPNQWTRQGDTEWFQV